MQKILKASSYYLEDVLGLNLNERAKEGKLSFILINHPPICDYHCRRCFMQDYRRKLYDPQKALTLDEYKDILKKAKNSGILCMEISGEGEPLLSKHILSVIEYADSLGILTTLITNGNTLTEEQTKFFKNHNVVLVFSLHTLDKAKYEIDNGCEGSFDKKIEHINMASEIFKDTTEVVNGHEVYRIAVHATLQKDNVNDIDDLKKFCRERNMFFSIAPLALTGNALQHPEICFDKNDKVLEDATQLGDNTIIHSHCSKEIFGREVCGTAFYGLNIGWDGSILFDAHYGYEVGENNLLGNIREVSFEDATKKQHEYMHTLFSNIDGSCPVRDPKGKDFLHKVLKGEIKI